MLNIHSDIIFELGNWNQNSPLIVECCCTDSKHSVYAMEPTQYSCLNILQLYITEIVYYIHYFFFSYVAG